MGNRYNSLLDRLLDAVVKGPRGCWLWTGKLNRGGYARVRYQGKECHAGRLCYELLVGPIPSGLDLDHLCRVRSCVNPDHVEPVTRRVNVLRGQTIPAAELLRTHCPAGHAYTPGNIYWQGRKRHCRECNMRWMRERWRRNRGKEAAVG